MDIKSFVEEYYVESTVNTPIGKIEISEGRNLYVAFIKRFKIMGEMATKAFSDKYDTYETCDDVLKNAYRDFQESIAIAFEDIQSAYISMGSYGVDYETLYKTALEQDLFQLFDSVYDSFESKVDEINDGLEEEMAYRQYRKDSRSQWVGGTIGGNALDAVNNQMKIGAMNAVGGAAHSVVNAAGNYLSKAQAESDLDDLVNDDYYAIMFMTAVSKAVAELKSLFIPMEQFFDLFEPIDSDDTDKAQRLLNNLEKGAIPADKETEIIEEIFALSPFNAKFYTYLFNKFGDDGALTETAEYFGMTAGLNFDKEIKAKNYFDSLVSDTEESALNAKTEMLEYCKKINLTPTDDSMWLTELDEKLADFDKQYRTVDGLEHETRESADFSKEELPKIQEFMKDVKPLKGEPLLPYEKTLIAQKEKFEESFSSEVSKKYLKTIEKHIEDFEKSFLAVGFLGESTREAAAKKRALKYAKGLKYSTVEEFDKQYETFCSFIQENLGVTIEEATEAKAYLDKKKDRLVNGSSLDLSSIGKGLKGLFGKK